MVAALFLAMFSHEHGLDQRLTPMSLFSGTKVKMVQDGEFVRHVHVTVFRNKDENGLLFDSECPPAAGAKNGIGLWPVAMSGRMPLPKALGARPERARGAQRRAQCVSIARRRGSGLPDRGWRRIICHRKKTHKCIKNGIGLWL